MWRRPACQTLWKALDISSATARASPELFKALAILSDTTVRRSDREDLDREDLDREDLNHTENHKKGHISLCDQQCRLFPNILK